MDDGEDDDFYAPAEPVQVTHAPNNANEAIPDQHQDDDMEDEEDEDEDDVRLQTSPNLVQKAN